MFLFGLNNRRRRKKVCKKRLYSFKRSQTNVINLFIIRIGPREIKTLKLIFLTSFGLLIFAFSVHRETKHLF